MKAKVLITGMAGLLGSNFSRHLLAEGYDVVGIDDFSGGYKENLADGAKCVNINLADLEAVDRFFRDEKPDYVYHFAAYAAEGLSPFIRKYNYTNNLICSANLITSSINHDVKKFIFTSSMATYGRENTPPFTEDMQPKPLDPYGVAKYAVEMDLKLAKEQFGLSYSIIRPHNIVGKYQNIWDRYRNVVGIWIRKAMHNEPLTIFGDGLQTRAFSDVKYYFKPFEQLMYEYDGEIFNLGAIRSGRFWKLPNWFANVPETLVSNRILCIMNRGMKLSLLFAIMIKPKNCLVSEMIPIWKKQSMKCLSGL